MGRVKAVPRDVIKAVPKGVVNKKKVFADDDDENDDEKVDVRKVSKKGKKAGVDEEEPADLSVAKKVSKKGKKAGVEDEEETADLSVAKKVSKKWKKAVVEEDAPEEISAKDNDEIRRLKEWHESLVTGNSKIKKRKIRKETSAIVDPSAALDLSVLEAYTQYNDTKTSDETSDDDETSHVQDNSKKIDKTARSKQVGNLQVTYIDPKLNDPFAVYHVSSSALEFTKTIKEQQHRVRYAVFRAQKKGGPSKVFKR